MFTQHLLASQAQVHHWPQRACRVRRQVESGCIYIPTCCTYSYKYSYSY